MTGRFIQHPLCLYSLPSALSVGFHLLEQKVVVKTYEIPPATMKAAIFILLGFFCLSLAIPVKKGKFEDIFMLEPIVVADAMIALWYIVTGSVSNSHFEGKLAAETNLCLYKENEKSLSFTTLESHWGCRNNYLLS